MQKIWMILGNIIFNKTATKNRIENANLISLPVDILCAVYCAKHRQLNY